MTMLPWRSPWPTRAQRLARRVAARHNAQREPEQARLEQIEGDRMERAGHLAAILAGRRPMKEDSMNDVLRKAISEAIIRIADKRTADIGNLLGQLRGLATDDGRDAAWKARERKRIGRAVDGVNGAARGELQRVTEPLLRDARTRQAAGTPLESSALAEAALLVQEYTGKTAMERRHVAADAAEALELGAFAKARTLHRAAMALGVAEDATAQGLDRRDPVKSLAASDLATVAGILEAQDRLVTIELAGAGLGGMSTSIAAELARHPGWQDADQPAPSDAGRAPEAADATPTPPSTSGADFRGPSDPPSRGAQLEAAQAAGDHKAAIQIAAEALTGG